MQTYHRNAAPKKYQLTIELWRRLSTKEAEIEDTMQIVDRRLLVRDFLL